MPQYVWPFSVHLFFLFLYYRPFCYLEFSESSTPCLKHRLKTVAITTALKVSYLERIHLAKTNHIISQPLLSS